ncbi:hypothetical protein D9M71_86140 [compost metagenome]
MTDSTTISRVGKRPGMRRTSMATPQSSSTNTSCERYPKGSVIQIRVRMAAKIPTAVFNTRWLLRCSPAHHCLPRSNRELFCVRSGRCSRAWAKCCQVLRQERAACLSQIAGAKRMLGATGCINTSHRVCVTYRNGSPRLGVLLASCGYQYCCRSNKWRQDGDSRRSSDQASRFIKLSTKATSGWLSYWRRNRA